MAWVRDAQSVLVGELEQVLVASEVEQITQSKLPEHLLHFFPLVEGGVQTRHRADRVVGLAVHRRRERNQVVSGLLELIGAAAQLIEVAGLPEEPALELGVSAPGRFGRGHML